MANQVLYGFYQLQHLKDERITEVGVDVIAQAITASVEEHNRQLNALLNALTFQTAEWTTRFQSVAAARLQPLDQNGRALPIRPAGYYSVGLPILHAGIAWGANYVSRIKMTVGEAERITQTMLMADIRWVRDHVLAALFADASWTFPDPLKGDLTVLPLASGDTQPYTILTGTDVPATDDHILAQAAAIDDSNNPFPAIKTELLEHPENGGRVIVLVPTGLVASISALATFYEKDDPNIQVGADSNRLVGAPGAETPGTLKGYVDGCWIFEWPVMPANYMVAYTTDGDPPIARRQEPEAELQGFRQEAIREDHPFWESQWSRREGYGAWNRVGAVIMRIGDGSYAVPTGYESPMA